MKRKSEPDTFDIVQPYERTVAATPEAQADEAPWRHYPHIDAAILAEKPPVLGSIEKTYLELKRVLHSGADREKERARAALLAYERALELYHHLADLRKQALCAASNTGSRMTITD